ncbi:hypothetical protein GCM10010988_30160 [Cnuibacter physcomitrellae]|nr:hypothetical protein GCM10010988_30160 [Cnuibacter physcomitrellae]
MTPIATAAVVATVAVAALWWRMVSNSLTGLPIVGWSRLVSWASVNAQSPPRVAEGCCYRGRLRVTDPRIWG